MLALALLTMLAAQPAKQSALTLQPGYKAVLSLDATHATQGAAADEKHFYAVSSKTVAQYDRETKKLIASATTPDTQHLNSAFLHDGKIYCAHSNYPGKPEQSDIRVFNPGLGTLATFHTFKDPPGSLVWCIVLEKRWWCCFAHYDKENAKTLLIRYDDDWKEAGRWTFPRKVVDDWDGMSASGGIVEDGTLLVSHHHFKVLYRLKLPKEPGELELIEAIACPFPGQGIAADPKTGGLVGIDRGKKQIILAERDRSRP